MKWFSRFSVVFLISIFSFGAAAFADGGTPTHCFVTVKKVMLKNSDGNWFVMQEADKIVDLAEEFAIAITNDGRIPPGTYVNFKITLSEFWKVSGSDDLNLTKEGGEITIGGSATKASELPGDIFMMDEAKPTWNKEKEGLITVHLDLDYRDRDEIMEIIGKRDLQKPLVIKKNSNIAVWFEMNLADTLHFARARSVAAGGASSRLGR